MVSVLTPRGSAGKSTYINKNVAFGQTSLEPMTINYNDKNYTIIYNGEIYNVDEIKTKLSDFDYSFKTNKEAEIVLASYIFLKEECVNYINGIFAFVILDENSNQLFIARDRLGVKPLFYTIKNGLFCFASEIKSILKYPEVKAKVSAHELCEIFGLGPAHTPRQNIF